MVSKRIIKETVAIKLIEAFLAGQLSASRLVEQIIENAEDKAIVKEQVGIIERVTGNKYQYLR